MKEECQLQSPEKTLALAVGATSRAINREQRLRIWNGIDAIAKSRYEDLLTRLYPLFKCPNGAPTTR